jgi:archaellum component FlaC
MEDYYEDINYYGYLKSPYSQLSNEQLIHKIEEEKKKNESLKWEVTKLKGENNATRSMLVLKDNEIENLKKRIEENDDYKRFILKGYEDYKQTSKDLKSLVEKLSDKTGTIKL